MNPRRSRWRRTRFAVLELMVIAAAAAAVIWAGQRVTEPLGGAELKAPRPPGCEQARRGELELLRIQLALSDHAGDEALPTLADVIRCFDHRSVADRLEESTKRDFLFVPAYVALLLWSSARVGGLGGRDSDSWGGRTRHSRLSDENEHPRHTRRSTVMSWLGRWQTRIEAWDAEARGRRSRAELRRAIADARAQEGRARWEARHTPHTDARWWARWTERRQKRKAAKQARQEAVRAAKQEFRAAPPPPPDADAGDAGSARADAPGHRFRRWVARRMVGLANVFLADGVHLARVDRNDTGRLVGQIGAWSAIVAGVLDVAENLLLLETAKNIRFQHALSSRMIDFTAGVALAKLLLLVLPIVLTLFFVYQLILALWRSSGTGGPGAAVHLPDPADPDRRWALPGREPGGGICGRPATNDREYGICFSGGGIRSATFALGALQELEALEVPAAQDPDGDRKAMWGIGRARYVSAVSGGSYMATAYQFLARRGHGANPEANLEDLDVTPRLLRRTLSRARFWPLVGRFASWASFRTLPGEPLPTGAAAAAAPARPLLRPAGNIEDHLRRHSTHLADGAAEWTHALGEIILRALTGLFILLLVIWTVAVPLGWLYQYALYGLRGSGVARDPQLALDLRIITGPLAALAALLGLRLLLAKPADALSRRWVFSGRRSASAIDQARAAASFAVVLLVTIGIVVPFVAVNVESAVRTVRGWVGLAPDPTWEPDTAKVNGRLADVISGTSAASVAAARAAGALMADDQGAVSEALRGAAHATDLAAIQVNDAVAALARLMDADDDDADDRITARPLAARFDPESCLPVAPRSQKPVVGAGDSVVVLACKAASRASAAADAVADLVRTAPSSPGAATTELTAAAGAAAEGASKASTAIRGLSEELSGDKSPAADAGESPPLAWAGLSAFIPLIGGIAAKRRLDVGRGPKPKESKSNRVAKMVGFGGATEVLAGIATVVIAVIAFSDVVVDSWRRRAGDGLKIIVELDAWQWWAGGLGLLVVLACLTNVNDWSLRPFYHRRLWLSYAVLPTGRTAPWRTDTRLSELGKRVDGFPELIICAAAQTSGREWAPPGRRALSFVFTADAVGGPEVGYMRTRRLEAMLGRRHRSAISLFGAMATSGAAFGPAMGRQSKGGLGAVMAIANARLGAWLPNPHHLASLAEVEAAGLAVRAGSIVRWPRLWYWFMETAGQYPTDAKLVLTSDGGHVENLGLVELLRRRCSRILCFDASGAGPTPTTLAEAIVMAREELDIEIVLQSPLGPDAAPTPTAQGTAVLAERPDGAVEVGFQVAARPVPAPTLLVVDEFAGDPLRRRSSMVDALAARIAARPVLVATIFYPETRTAAEETGTLVYGTLALADDGPEEWDILEFAQRNDIFPNDGTARQWFDASTFAAYQQLGRRTARRMVAEAVRTVP